MGNNGLVGVPRCSEEGCTEDRPEFFHRSFSTARGYQSRCKKHQAVYNASPKRKKTRAAADLRNSRTIKGRFVNAKAVAKSRGIHFELTLDQYSYVVSTSCHHCGGNLPEAGSGLDRVDGSGGYCVGNVVPCCTVCNIKRNQEMARRGAVGNVIEVIGVLSKRVERLFNLTLLHDGRTIQHSTVKDKTT
jgi:hypothetical protein